MNYAMVRDGVVVNIAVWDGESEWATDGFQVFPLAEGVRIGWVFADGEFIAPPAPVKTYEGLVNNAEQERQSRLVHANAVTADWRTDLFLGTISDENKAKLIMWMQYVKDVKAVDISTAPDIEWPDKPAL